MRSIRLLPVVIFAALALLVFKGIGLVTNGSYVLTGPVAVVAQEGGNSELSLAATPSEATMADTSPTIDDTTPTVAAKAEGSASGEKTGSSSAAPHGESPEGTKGSSAEATASVAPSSNAPASEGSSAAAMATGASGCATASAPAGGEGAPTSGEGQADCDPSSPVNAHGDALPTVNEGGKIVPLQVAEGDESAPLLLQRLGERRAQLDKRQADLDMRESIVAAAEQKLEEKTKALEALQTQVAALVDEKAAAEDAGFKGIVAMYEQMKPKDAAKIFDTLNLNVMLKIARAMNPRKVSPVLAAMSSEPAQALTVALATTDIPQQAVAMQPAENLAQLPQIVGH